MKLLKHTLPAVALLLAGFNSAHGALLDFTDPGVSASGSILGTSYAITGTPGTPNRNENFDGTAACPVSSGLYCATPSPDPSATDGFGIGDDEITGDTQTLAITFGRVLKVTGIHLLDFYINRNDSSKKEKATVEFFIAGVSQGAQDFEATVVQFLHGHHFESFDQLADEVVLSGAKIFGDDGSNDFSFAGITAVPVPAAAWLFGSALIGLAGLGRRRQAG